MSDYLIEEQEEMKHPVELSQVNFAVHSSIHEPIVEAPNEEEEEDDEDEKMLAARYNLNIRK
jgi:hypothetical protein